MSRVLLITALILCLGTAESHAGKKDLAEKMNELRPVGEQVDAAIEQMAEGLPKEDRPAFQSYLRNSIDFQAIDKISVDAMAETFTEKELKAMVEYYSKPEAISASKKLENYQKKVSPEIIRMIDRAMMKARTGGTGP